MPVVFAAHGAAVQLDDPVWMAELVAWAQAMPRPKAILMISAHWDRRPTTLGATETVPLVDLHRQGRLPFDRLVKFYDMDQIEQALAGSKSGKVIKPILRMQRRSK
jgi:hypothetical protein